MAVRTYNWNKLPQWGDPAITASQFLSAETGTATAQLAPYSQSFATGYDAEAGRVIPSKRHVEMANATLCDNSYYFPLFIQGISIDFSLAGTTAQSKFTRDMYPHNIVIPGFSLDGQCYDQTSYGMLCEFVHAHQRDSVSNAKGNNLMQLWVAGNRYPKMNGGRQGSQGVTHNGVLQPNQTIKGSNSEILCLGYIMSMPRQHQTGVYQVDYTLQFTVANMVLGPYTDNQDANTKQSSWVSMLTGTDASDLGTPSQLKQNNKILKYASQHAGETIQSSAS